MHDIGATHLSIGALGSVILGQIDQDVTSQHWVDQK